MKNIIIRRIRAVVSMLLISAFIVSCSGNDDTSNETSTSQDTSATTGTVVGTTGVTTIAPGDPSSCNTLSGTAKLVCLCEQFKASLSTTQQATLLQSYTFANIKTWSNLPASMSSRLGLRLGDLTSSQVALAKAIVKHMSGTTSNEGYDEVQQSLLADDYLNANGGGSTYGSGNYYISFFGTPSITGTFEILFTGHHKTIQGTYTNGALVSSTPSFAAIEPLSFVASGTTYEPMLQEKTAFVNLLSSLSASELATAKSSSTFTDLVCRPTANWSFPTVQSGLKCSELTSAQKKIVMDAIATYVKDVDDTNAASILATYFSEIDSTYILYSGTTNLNTLADYIRIDGPHVWIEFSVQPGIVIRGGIHYHSIWRDRVNDYGTTKS